MSQSFSRQSTLFSILVILTLSGIAFTVSCRKKPIPVQAETTEKASEVTENPPSESSNAVITQKPQRQAVALSGCVVLDQDGKQVQYKKKCESCGYLFPGTVRTSIPSKGAKLTSGFRCSKCGSQQKIILQGT